MNTKSYISILALVVMLLAGGVFMFSNGQTQATSAAVAVVDTASVSQVQPLSVATTPVKKPSSYRDGTYMAVGSYGVPEGKTESINVSVTIQNGNIIDSLVTASPHDHDSKRFINQFISGYKAYITGKSVDAVRLDTVSGSSLTSNGWNSAIESIKTQAAV